VKLLRGAWVAPALAVLGGTLLVEAVWRGTAWTLLGVASGLVLGLALRWGKAGGRSDTDSFDLPDALEQLRRAHDARAGWVIGLSQGPVEVVGDATLEEPGRGATARRRGAAFVQLASVDGRVHVAHEVEGTYVALGDFPYGTALLLTDPEADQPRVTTAVNDLRRLIETMRQAEQQTMQRQGQLLERQLALGVAGAQTVAGIARAGVELAQQLTERGAAVVIRSVREREAIHVIAVSTAADQRLTGRRLDPNGPVARAIHESTPIVTSGGAEDVFGPGMPERRRHERGGAAYPLMDGHHAIGALVIVGREAVTGDRIAALVAELGPRLAAAIAVQDAEQRALLDPLTGLRNRGEFQRALESYRESDEPPPASLIHIDLDYFKRLNDTLGHPAGDAALKHIARVLEAAVRDGDLVARIGGEEFAVWLPHAPLGAALEVAERIRDLIANTTWHWSATAYPLTASCGVASYPDPIADLLNLTSAADAALFRAKELGRNRVEKARRPN